MLLYTIPPSHVCPTDTRLPGSVLLSKQKSILPLIRIFSKETVGAISRSGDSTRRFLSIYSYKGAWSVQIRKTVQVCFEAGEHLDSPCKMYMYLYLTHERESGL